VALRGENALLTLEADDLSELKRIESILDRPRAIAVTEAAVTVVHRGDHFLQFSRMEADDTGLPMSSLVKSIMLRADLPWDMELNPNRIARTVPNRGRAVTINPETGIPLVVHNQTMPGDLEESLLNSLLKGELFTEDICEMEGEETEDCAGTATTSNGETSGYGGGSKTKFPGLVRPIETVVTSGGILTPGTGGTLPVKAPEHDTTLNARVAQPTDIHHHPTWTMAFITGYGSDNVMVINTSAFEPMANPIALINVGAAPKAVAFSQDGQWAYTLNHHSFTISAIDLAPLFEAIEQPVSLESVRNQAMLVTDPMSTMAPVTMEKEDHSTFVFGIDPLPKSAQIGRRIYTYVFNDKLNGDNRFACGSCHFEGAEDQMVWVTPDGIRQTPTLAGRLHDTAPFNWTGSENTLAGNMTQTIDRMDGEGLSDVELASLGQFLLIGLERPVNPYRLDTGLTDAQAIGSDLFHSPSVGCASCHSGPAYTDGKFYSVGTNNQLEDELAMLFADLFEGSTTLPTKFNTPSLRDLFATAPYFHNGSAETVMDVLDQTATTMGHTANLTLEQKEALVAYLLTL
jgi:cytochrome c peroxidase